MRNHIALCLLQKYLIFIVLFVNIVGIANISVNTGVIVAQTSIVDESLKDNNLQAEKVVDGLELPTSMAFLGPNDILVLEKDTGEVKRVKDGQILSEPLLHVNVTTDNIERGLLGIAISKNTSGHTYVFLYYTEAESSDGEDQSSVESPLGNRLYRYEFVNNKLINPKLMMDLPATPGPGHNGGKITIGPDNNVYVVVGDVWDTPKNLYRTKAENYENDSISPDGRSGVLRITQDGKIVGEGILGKEHPLNMYYAYGIRNSFGIAFDPLTGNLWETENGDGRYDEINLVSPGFNSGWQDLMGFAKERQKLGLVNFNGNGHYSDPEFVWNTTVAPTAIEFFNSKKLGPQYENDIFLGDYKYGRIYNFNINSERNGLELTGDLTDKKFDNTEGEQQEVIFGEGFGGVTDLKVGLGDGYLYVLSWGDGAIYKIFPNATSIADG